MSNNQALACAIDWVTMIMQIDETLSTAALGHNLQLALQDQTADHWPANQQHITAIFDQLQTRADIISIADILTDALSDERELDRYFENDAALFPATLQ